MLILVNSGTSRPRENKTKTTLHSQDPQWPQTTGEERAQNHTREALSCGHAGASLQDGAHARMAESAPE